jgi:plasmid stabilization system protein ParE
MAAFRLTPSAAEHIGDIVGFIAADDEDAFDLLASRPGIGHVREDLTDRPLKFWSVYSYLVVYDPAGDPLTIVAVPHGARDVAQILKEIG